MKILNDAPRVKSKRERERQLFLDELYAKFHAFVEQQKKPFDGVYLVAVCEFLRVFIDPGGSDPYVDATQETEIGKLRLGLREWAAKAFTKEIFKFSSDGAERSILWAKFTEKVFQDGMTMTIGSFNPQRLPRDLEKSPAKEA